MSWQMWCIGFWSLLAASQLAGASEPAPRQVRFTTYNIEILSAEKLKRVDAEGRGNHPQLLKAAEIIQRVRPDVLLINEIDYDGPDESSGLEARTDDAATRFYNLYLKVEHHGQAGLDFPHRFYRPSNTGVPTGKDLDNDGKTTGPADAYGFGNYPGQYGLALYSRFPIVASAARTFRKLRWTEMPGNLMPDGTGGKPAFYAPDEVAVFRLSSKSHWDVPIEIGNRQIHILAAHPTPPIFDGPEDSNGRRNFDEIRLWADYIAGGDRAQYIRDDEGRTGGLPQEAEFVILGDLNSDPVRGDAPYGKMAIRQLLDLPQVHDPKPQSMGSQRSPHVVATTDYLPFRTSNFGRLDYCLPSRGLEVRESQVFWPTPDDPLHALVAGTNPASDHYLVWADLVLPNR
ncbi:MAG: endonuclease/exonuclease/phosphatase family protein [Planctomycetes bacterium]|nr:endonuclease/exonuclease/phosphatase family protein [Planctomycetota bacterium]